MPQEPPLETAKEPSRRTLLAGERTFLSWWRTGLTALTAGIAVAQVVPQLAESENRWPYTVVGVLLVALGGCCMAYGSSRHHSLGRALRRGEYQQSSPVVVAVLAIGGVLAAVVLAALIIAGG